MIATPSEYTPTGGEGQAKFSPADILFKYLAFLPLFVASLAISVTLGIMYLRYTTPKFVSSIQILIKSSPETETTNQGELLDKALFGSKQINISNEIERLRSPKVIESTVAKNEFHINYFNEGNIRTSNLYSGQTAFRLVPVNVVDSNRTYRFRFTDMTRKGYVLLKGTEIREPHRWEDVLQDGPNQFKLQPIHPMGETPAGDDIQIATWVHPKQMAGYLLGQLSIYPTGGETTILMLSIRNDNALLGRAILQALVLEYNLYSIEVKNASARNTIDFITERIDSLGMEIKFLEDNIETLKDRRLAMNLEQQASWYFGQYTTSEQAIIELEVQLSVAQLLRDYISKPTNRNKLVPSSMGLADGTLGGMIGAYNSLQQQREREMPNLQPGGALMLQLDNELEEVRQSILESLRNFTILQDLKKKQLAGRNAQSSEFLSQLPDKQRRMMELERQQNVKENLYLYLLQKKEETALTTVNTTASYEQLSDAGGSLSPVEPDEKKIRMFSILFGLLLPIGIIYIRDMLNDRIYTRDDIQKKTKVSIIGEIGHVDDNRSLVVAHQSRNIVSEQFRIIRSNLGFFMKDKPFKTILVTSTISGEGKSFVSINLAAVLALNNRKVALLEFDLRKPRILANLSIEKTGVGISNYLLGMARAEEIYTPLENFPTLHIYPSGVVPPNPAELVMSENNRAFFDYLKAEYDYIIIDSAPVGLVSDTFSLAPYVDVSLYIMRHRFTYKRQIAFLDEVYQQRKLPNLFLVVNDLKMGARFGYYGYGYGYGKGYGYGYGYYYGYGNRKGGGEYYDLEPGMKKKWWQFFKR